MNELNKRPPPDLQKLVAKHGNYRSIPPEAWAEFDANVEQYHADMVAGHTDKWGPAIEPDPLIPDPTIELMPILDVIAELREGQWVSSRNKADWNRRMLLWQRLDEHVRKRVAEATRRI